MPPAAGRAPAPPRDEEFVVVELGAQQVVHQQPPINPAAAAGSCVCLCGVMSAWAVTVLVTATVAVVLFCGLLYFIVKLVHALPPLHQ